MIISYFYRMNTFIIVSSLLLSCLAAYAPTLLTYLPRPPTPPAAFTSEQSVLQVEQHKDQEWLSALQKQTEQQIGLESLSSSFQLNASSPFFRQAVKQHTFLNEQSLDTLSQRFLQQQQPIQTNNIFIKGLTALFQWILPITRNLILVGLFTNSIDIFLPYLLLSESFLMLGFWTCQKHYLTNLFAGVFSSYCDLLNAVRLVAQPNSPPNLPHLSQYGFSSILLFNLAGELLLAVLLLLFTVVSKGTNMCKQHEYLNKMSNNLRALWNSCFFAILPRVATFAGLHLREFGHISIIDVINGLTCAILLLIAAFFFVMLILQTKQVLQKGQSVQEQAGQLGVASRIDAKKQFSFDCLRWSSLYHPCINYLRFIVYFLPIGLIWDCQQLSYGGAMASQLFIVMIQFTSPCYILLKDRILFPVLNFLLFLVQFCLITIGLAESAPYSPLSQNIQIALLCILFVTFSASLGSTGKDCWREIQERWLENHERKGTKSATTHRLMTQTNKTAEIKKSEPCDEFPSDTNDQKTRQNPTFFRKNIEQLTKLRIKRKKEVKWNDNNII